MNLGALNSRHKHIFVLCLIEYYRTGVLEGLAALQPRCCGSETEERKRLGGWLEFVQCATLHVGRGIKE